MANRFAIALGASVWLATTLGCGSHDKPSGETKAVTAIKPALSAQAPQITPKAAAPAASADPALLVATARRDECAQCQAPRYCSAGLCIESGAVVASGKRGANYGEIAPELFRYQDMDESEAVAPGGLAASDADGRLFVLDQLDDQIHVYHADDFEDAIATPSDAAIDYFTLLPDGSIVLLDSYGSRNVLLVIDRQGKVLQEQPLAGKGFAEHEPAYGLCTRPDGVWARRASDMLRVMDLSGEPDPERPIVEGLLSGDGKSVLAARVNGMTLEVSAKPRSGAGAERKGSAVFDKEIQLLQTESDAAGRLYARVQTVLPIAKEGTGRPVENTWLLVFTPELQILRRVQLPEKTIPHTVQTPMFVSPAGLVYYLDVERMGLAVRRY